MRRLLLAFLLAVGFATNANAAGTCDTIAAGSYLWTSVAANLWTDGDCTEDGAATFVIPSGVTITTAGDVTMTTGAIQINTGGVLNHMGGHTISWTGATATGLEVRGGTYRAQGTVLWSGRIGGAVTYAAGPPETAAFTIPIASISSIATTSDFLVVGDDDPTNASAAITQPVQVGAGPPIPGYYRPSKRKWAWHKIQAAPASSTLTIHTNDFTDAESLAPANDGYDRTRGPIAPTNKAIVGTPARIVGDAGTISRVVYGTGAADDIVDLGDGDGGLQEVEFTSGACSDVDGTGKSRNMAFSVAYIDDEGGGADIDHVYVHGDASGCGSGVNTRIHYGLKEGDPIKLVRPAILAGAAAQNGPQILWSAGSIQADYARFVHLDSGASGEGLTLAGQCVICAFKTASTAPAASTSYITNSQISYPRMPAATDTGVLSFEAWAAGLTAYQTGVTSPLDMSGFVLDRVYISDSAAGDPDETGIGNGHHGIHCKGANNLTGTRLRIERLSDDGIACFANSLGSDSTTMSFTFRHVIVGELVDSSGASNSQQCLDIGSLATGSATDALLHTWTLSDVYASGCADGVISHQGTGSTFERFVGSGSPLINTYGIAALTNFTALPVAAISTRPNVTRDAVFSTLGTGGGTTQDIGGAIYDSILNGNGIAAGTRQYRHVTYADGVAALMGTAMTSVPWNRGSAAPLRITSSTWVNSLVLVSSASANARVLCLGFDTTSFTSIALRRVALGFERVGGTGFLSSGGINCVTGTDTTQPFTANGLLLTTTTANTGSVGRGGSDQGTAQGANITNACVRASSNVPTNTGMFGANATASSIQSSGPVGPDPIQDVPISAFVAKEGSTSICESLARPEYLGLRKFGAAHALAGDGIVAGIENYTTHEKLIRTVSGGGGGSVLMPSAVVP